MISIAIFAPGTQFPRGHEAVRQVFFKTRKGLRYRLLFAIVGTAA